MLIPLSARRFLTRSPSNGCAQSANQQASIWALGGVEPQKAREHLALKFTYLPKNHADHSDL